MTKIAGTAVLFLSAALGPCSWAAPADAVPGGKAFASPQAAAEALIQAADKDDVPALLEIFGPDGKDIVTTTDTVQDKRNAAAFAAEAKAMHDVAVDPKNPSRATLTVGTEKWPFPVPIVKVKGQWYFNAKEGREEILFRRIGANELDAIQVCRGYVEAQKEYATLAREYTGVAQYAQKVFSSPGKKDGLFWKNADGSTGGPISEAVARAIEEGYKAGGGTGYHGYFFKILKGQGPAAPMGEMDYVIKGIMIGGFAFVAVPSEYRVTGVKTFIISHDGILYEQDLGPDSVEIFKRMELYNPDKTWTPTDAQWPADAWDTAKK